MSQSGSNGLASFFCIILLLLPFSSLSFTHHADDVEPSPQELTVEKESDVALSYSSQIVSQKFAILLFCRLRFVVIVSVLSFCRSFYPSCLCFVVLSNRFCHFPLELNKTATWRSLIRSK